MNSNIAAKMVATFGGVGYLPKAPGTWGSMLAAGIYALLGTYLSHSGLLTYILIAFIIVTYIAGIWSINKVKEEWGSDPSRVVIDEACGIFVTLLPVTFSLSNAFLGLVLFRVFDIWKPLGIRKIDQIESQNGHTVMLDDVAAGIYASVVLGCINLWL